MVLRACGWVVNLRSRKQDKKKGVKMEVRKSVFSAKKNCTPPRGTERPCADREEKERERKRWEQ